MSESKSLSRLLQEHTCLYASFDKSVSADVSRGSATPRVNTEVVRHEPDGGRFGGALAFSAKDHGWAEDEFTFAAKGNFPYRSSSFEGTISLWLRGDPDADLSPDYPVDPFHISRHAADGSFYLDLTRPNDWRYASPRKLRFGFYNDSPEQNMFLGGQLIVVGDLSWDDQNWHHIVATWRNTNSGAANGEAELYIDGRLRGWMKGYEHRLTWDIDALTIGLGQRYVGAIDEMLILDASIVESQVEALFTEAAPLRLRY